MKVVACIEDPVVNKQILDHLKHKAEASEPGVQPEGRAPPAELQQEFARLHQEQAKILVKQTDADSWSEDLFDSLVQRAFRGDL